jgi:hypothetical protein
MDDSIGNPFAEHVRSAAIDLSAGKSEAEIIQDLGKKGIYGAYATYIVQQAREGKPEINRQISSSRRTYGCGMIILGALILGISYALAAPGRVYLIPTGLFVVGVINILR